MKVKRLVSVLLAALLLVGMIPMNAFAWANKEGAGNDLAEIEVMISKNPPQSVSGYLPSYEGTDLKEDNIKENIKKANAAWDGVKWDESTQQFVGNREVVVAPGDIVYVGFKIRHINPSEYIGIALGTAILKFDTDVMTYSNEDHVLDASALIQEMYTNDASKDSSPVIGNLLSQSFARQDISNYTEPVKEILKKYIGSLQMNADGTGYRNESYVLTGYLSLMFNRKTTSQFSVSNASAWDFVVPMKVLETATKGDTLFVSAPSSTTATGVTLTKISPNRSGNTVGGSSDNKSLGTEAELITNTVSVKLASPNIEVPKDGKTVALANNKVTFDVVPNEFASKGFAAAAGTPGNWTIKQGANTFNDASTISVSLSSDNKKATITVTSDQLTKGDFTVTADPSVLADTATSIDELTYTAAEAPTAKFDHSTNKVTNITGDGDLEIRVKNVQQPIDVVNKGDVDLTAHLNTIKGALNDGDTKTDIIEIAVKGSDDLKTGVSVSKKSQPGNPTIDYVEETITIPATTTIKGSSSDSTGTGSAIDVVPGTTYNLYTAGDTEAFESSVKEFKVKDRPAKPSVSNANDDATNKAGNTKLTAPAGLKYVLESGNSTSKTPKEISKTGTAVPSNNVIEQMTPDKYLFAVVPAVADSSFASAISDAVQGSGWTNSTVTLRSVDFDAGTITLDLTGPEGWNGDIDGTATYFEISPAATYVSFSNGVLTYDELDPSKSYTLTVHKGVINNNKLGDSDGQSTEQLTITLTSDAVQLTADGGYTFDPSVIPAGTTQTVTVGGTVMNGKSLKTVTANSSDVTIGAISGKTVSITAGSVSGLVEVKLTITTDSTPLQYTGTSVELADSTVKTLEPSNVTDLTGVTITKITPKTTGAPTDGLEVDSGLTLKTSGDKFQSKGTYTYTVEGSNGATVDVTITVTGIAATPDFSGLTKKWDGTDDLTTNVTGEVKWKDKEGTELTGTYSGTYTLNDTDVGTTANVDVTEGTFTLADGTEYDVAAGTYDVTVVAAEIASIDKIEDVTVTAGNTTTVKKVAEELAKAKVTTTTDTGAKVEATLGDVIDEADIKAIIKDQLQAAALPEAIEKAKDEWIKAYKEEHPDDDDDTVEAAVAAAADEIEATAKAAVKAEIDDDYVIPAGDVSITLPYTMQMDKDEDGEEIKITAKTDAQLSDNVEEADLSEKTIPAIKATVKKKSTGGGGSYVPNVELETNGFGTPDGPVEVDENGKITKLPGVIGQKLGTVFKGWATQDGNPNTIVKEGREITTDTTLYGIFEGYMNGDKPVNGVRTARPSDNVTRGELVTMLVRAVGLYDDSVDYTTTFADAKGAWYTTYVGCAETFGILEGDAEGTARPKDNITREEAAILIAKTFKVDVATGGTTDYVVDFDKTANWAKDYVAAIVNNGTAVGNDHKEYEPKKPITRAEVAAMINKYLGLTAAKKSALTSNSSPFVDVTNSNSWYYSEMLFASLNAPYDYYVTEITYPTR